jgi:hypothetical protein
MDVLKDLLRTSEVPKNFRTSSPDGRHNTVRSPAEICLGTRPSQADAAKPTNKAPTIPVTVWSRDMVNPADRACGEPVRPARAWRRLCHIFVRAQRESFLPLYVAPLGGEHHDAPVPPGWIAAYLLANSVAVTTRDHESTKSGSLSELTCQVPPDTMARRSDLARSLIPASQLLRVRSALTGLGPRLSPASPRRGRGWRPPIP